MKNSKFKAIFLASALFLSLGVNAAFFGTTTCDASNEHVCKIYEDGKLVGEGTGALQHQTVE